MTRTERHLDNQRSTPGPRKPRQRGSSIQRVETASGPRWRFRIDLEPGPDGKRRQRTITCSTEAEAIRKQANLRVAVNAQAYVEPSKITVDRYFDEWLVANERNLRASTHNGYRGALEPARKAFGTRRMQTVTKSDVDALVAKMLKTGGRTGEGRSPRTVGHLLVILHRIFSDAVDDGIVARNVTDRVKKPRVEHREMSLWTVEEVSLFLSQVEDDPLVGCWALSARGLRRGEVLGLRWGDVDLTGKTVTVRQARVQAGKDVVTNAPKTERGRRVLPLDDSAVAALRKTRDRTLGAEVVPLRSGRALGIDERLVATDATGAALRPHQYSAAFLRHAKAAGLRRIRLHDLRHSAITIMLERGVPVSTAAKFAGHDPAIALRVYGHVTDRSAQEAANVLGRAFEGR